MEEYCRLIKQPSCRLIENILNLYLITEEPDKAIRLYSNFFPIMKEKLSN